MIKNAILYYTSTSKYPANHQSITANIMGTWSLVLIHWTLYFVIEFVIIALLHNIGLLHEPDFKLKLNSNLTTNLLETGLIIPIIEEIVFRQWLIYSRFNVALPVSVLSCTLIHKALHYRHISLTDNIIIWCVAILTATAIYYLINNCLKKITYHIEGFWKRNQRAIVIFSALLFGYLHIGNYMITANLILFSPIVLGTYLIAGFLTGYLRVQYGFVYNCLFHITTNSSVLLLKYVLKH